MKFGTAPVSFGVYGPPEDGAGVSADQLAAAMAACGYQGAEFPPAGYAGPPGAAARLFELHGLSPVGIYIPIHFAEPARRAVDEARMEEALSELQATRAGPRLAILADEGSEALLHNPGRGNDPTHALSAGAFGELTEAVDRLAATIRRRELTPSFHPHVSTYVESPGEIERLLHATDIDLTFDTGHISLGGGDLLECWDAWRDRINHVHLKDVRHDVMEQARTEGRRDFDVWWAEVSTPLGQGDLRLEEFLARLSEARYEGWVVVEQDRAPVLSGEQLDTVIAVQAANLEWIRLVEQTLSPRL